MKSAIIILLITMPVFAFAQSKKDSWIKKKRQEMKEYYSKTPVTFTSPQDEAGFHLNQAGSYLIGGVATELLGAGMVIAGADNDSKAIIYAGGGAALVGLVLQIVGYAKIISAGKALRKQSKISFNGTSISFNF